MLIWHTWEFKQSCCESKFLKSTYKLERVDSFIEINIKITSMTQLTVKISFTITNVFASVLRWLHWSKDILLFYLPNSCDFLITSFIIFLYLPLYICWSESPPYDEWSTPHNFGHILSPTYSLTLTFFLSVIIISFIVRTHLSTTPWLIFSQHLNS